MLAESANRTKKGGQELIGGLDVRVNRNHFGRQIESFQADLNLPFLGEIRGLPTGSFPGIFIRAPIVERILPTVDGIQEDEQAVAETIVAPSRQAVGGQARKVALQNVKVMATLPGRLKKAGEVGVKTDADEETGDIIAVQQGNVFGTSFHPELSSDTRIHVWWLTQVLEQRAS
jgi:pyridoxal 5'-phosphate synthase pdxT subunit